MSNQTNKDEQEQKSLIRQQSMQNFLANSVTKKKGIGGHVRDTGLSLLSGAVSVPETAVGLADIVSGGNVGKFLENENGAVGFRPKEAKEAIAGWKTERSQRQLQDFQNAEGLGAKFGQAYKNPSLVVNTVLESLPAMGAGGVIGRGLGVAAKGISPLVGGALGEGAVGAGLAAEQIRQQTADGLLTPKQAGLAAATGAATAGFGFAGGRLAKELGIADFDTSLVSGNLAGRTAAEVAEGAAKQPGIAKRVAGGALSEGFLEELPQSVSETILQNEALGRPLGEGVEDAAVLGLLSGATMGGVVGGITRNRTPTTDDITPTEDMGQEAPRLGLPSPNRPSGNTGLIEDANSDYFNRGQGPNAANMRNLTPDPELTYNSELGGQFSATQDGTVFSEAEYNNYLAQQQAQARATRDAGMSDINDITQVPEGYEQFGSDPRLPAPRSDFEVTPDGTAQTAADVNTSIQNERAANAERMARRLRGEIQDNTPVPSDAMGFGDIEPVDNRKLSERMGLDPNKGSLSAAAAIAVDTGASSVAADFEQASAPTQSAWQSGMMDRLSNADQNNSTYARLAQAMQNEPKSVSEKTRLMREADELPRAEIAARQIKPNTRVLDEARAQTRAYTPEGKEVQAQWDVVDASDLVTSNTDNFTINPNFPASRQPRDRTRASAQQQVNDIASKLQPNLLGESPDVSTGAPFVGANDNVVDSGNGRSMAIRRVYQENGEKAQAYRQFVNEQAGKFGLDTNAVNMMQSPVLVRRNTSDMNRDEFARAANKPTAARMSSTEQAASDAKNLPDASLLSFNGEGSMSLHQSQRYLKNFIAALPKTEQGSLMDESGALSREGKSRIEAAIVQDAYNNPRLVSAISEKLDNDTTNVLRAVTDKAPQISQINADIKTGDVYDNTLARDIADATQAYIDLKNTDKNINDYLSQDSLLGDGLTDGAKEILSVLSDNRRSAKAIGEYIQERINQVTGRGNPKQGGLSFDDEFETDAPNVLSNEPAPTNTQAATQLTDENPTVNIPEPKQTRPKVESTEPPVRDMPIGEWVDKFNDVIDSKRAKQKAESAKTDLPAATTEISGKNQSTYRLPTKEESYWRLSQPSTERESVLVGAVSQALDEGVIYNKDLNKRVAEILNVPQSVLDVNTRNTENGDFGYDVYSARKKVEANNRDNSNNEARERLKSRLSVGRNIGTIVIDNGKTLRRATIESMDDKSVKIAGTTGSKRLMYGVNYSTLEDAIKRAEDEGKREKFTAPKVATVDSESEATPESKLTEKYGFNDSNKLDHGELSIPNRTKNIDSELDRYKADKAKIDAKKLDEVKTKNAEKAEAEKERLLPIKEQAQADYKQYGTAMVNAYKDKLEAQGVNARDFIRDEAKYNPESFLKLSKKFQEEQQAEPQSPVEKPEAKAIKPQLNWTKDANSRKIWRADNGMIITDESMVVGGVRNKSFFLYENQTERYAGNNVERGESLTEAKDKAESLVKSKPETAPETKKPTAKKADKPATPIETVTEIEDFGEKITGARKDMQSFYQKEITDDDIISQPLSKIWPKKDVDAIEDTQQAALATVFRSAIPSKPRKGYKLDRWVATVKTFRGVMQSMVSDTIPFDKIMDGLVASERMSEYAYHAKLLAKLDREQWSRIDKVDPQIGYQKRNENGDYIPFVGFAVTIDKRTHTFNTEQRDISEIIDKVNNLLAGEVKTQALKFDLYSRGRGDAKSWFITQTSDKDKTPLIEFNDRDAARAFLKENNSELSELWDQHKERVNVKKSDMRSNVNRERIGPDHRSGQDVTTEQFMNTFGLRGGQFGNWVKQGANSKDRQNMLNDAYDAFMDLAGVLNIPPEAIGLGGKLAMSFGARGKGRAMAHYEPSQVIINLTKTQGAGSLAHEWFHALDNHFTSFRDDPNRLTSKENAYITYKPEPMLIMKDQNGNPSRMRPITEMRRKQLYEMNKNRAYLPENFMPDPNHKEGVRPQVEVAFANLVEALDESPMKARAVTIDKGAADGYWSRIIERAARAFESYVINKLEKQGARSDFLANVTPENAFPRNMDRYPYLLESEMAPVAEAFDNLFATLDSKASEDGNGKTLFSRAGQLNEAIDKVKANAVGSTNTTRQQVIGKLNDKFGKETIAKLMSDGKLDIKVLSDFMIDGKLTIPSDVDGLYHNGKATLIADNLSDDMIIPTFLHELGGHGGMQTLMDKKAYDALMRDFDSLVTAGDPLAMQAKAMADKVARNEQDALDEYLPYLITLTSRQQAKQGKVAGMINRMVMAIRSWLKNTLGVPIAINSQDILSLAERMVNEIEKQGSLDNVANAAPQFSDPNIPDKQLQDVRDQYENTDQWMTAPNGKPTNLTENQWVQTRTPAFKQWFGDWENDPKNASKIVDDNGEPRITYHQTDDTWNTFDKSKAKAGKHDNETPTGIFVKGSDRDIGIGENLNQMPLFTNIKNPLELKDRQAAKKYYESNIDGYADIVASMKKDDDTYSKALDEAENSIQAELKRRYETGDRSQSSKELFKKSRDILNEWTASQQANSLAAKKLIDDHLAENDIDGVVLEVDEGSFGRETDAIIAINNNQIKSATDNIGTFDNTNPDIRFSDPNVPAKQLDDVRDKYEGTDRWLKAPNGKPSNLTKQQWLQVRTPAFKQWFGDWEGDAANASKVVDDNGEPMVVYHGSPKRFYNFDINNLGKRTNNLGHFGKGFYFTPDIDTANRYAGYRDSQGDTAYNDSSTTYRGYLNIKKPFYDTYENLKPYLDGVGVQKIKDGIDRDYLEQHILNYDPALQILIDDVNKSKIYPDGDNTYEQYKKNGGKLSDEYQSGVPLDYDGIAGILFGNIYLTMSEREIDSIQKMMGAIPDKYISVGFSGQPTLAEATSYGQKDNGITENIMSDGFDGVIHAPDGVSKKYIEYVAFNPNQIKSATDNAGTFDGSNPDIRFSRAAGMNDQFDPRNIARESATRLYDWASSAPPGKLSWWHKTIGTMYNLAQRNPYFKPVFENTEKFINDVSFYASKASEFAPRLLPQLDSIRDITKSAIGAKDNEALSKPIFEGTLLWGRDLDGKAVLIEDWRKKVMAASKQDRLQMLKDANRITPAQLQQLATLNNIQANRFINGIIDEEVNAGIVWTDNELRSKFNLNDKQIELYREFRATTDNSLDSMTRSDMLRRLGKDATAIETAVMEAGTLREAVFTIEQHINGLIQASPKKEKSLKNTLKDIKESQFRTNKLIDDGYAPLSRFGQYTVDVVDKDGNREYFGMFESAYEARKMKGEMDALYGDDQDFTVTQGALSKEEFKLFAGVTPETAELFGEMMGLDATGDKAADDAFQEYLRRTKNNRSTMKRLMHRKGIKGYSEDVGRVLASFVYSNARHTSAALNMGNLDRSIQDIPKGEGQLKDAAVKLAEYIKNPQEEGNVIRGWMFAQYLGGSIASAAVNITQPIAVSFPYLSQFGGAVKAASQLKRSSSDWAKSLKNKNNDHFEADLRDAIARAEADGTLSPQEVHNLLKQASGKNPLSAGDGTKIGNAKALAGNTLSRVSLAWGSLFSLAEQVNRRVTFVAAYRMAVEQGMDNPAEFATKSIKETQFVYNKASRMNWGRGAVGGTLMTFKTYTVSYMELMHRLWTQGEKGSEERAQGRKAVGIMLGTLFLLGGAGGLPFMEDAEDLVDGIGQIMGYNFSSKKVRQDFLDEWIGEFAGDFIDGGISSVSGSPTDVSGRLGLGNLIPGTGIFKERTSNVRDILEVAGPAGDFVGRVGTGTRDIAKGVANLDTTSLKKGALEFAPTAVRNAVKGVSMATTGIYKDTKGYKVADVSPIDSAFKAIGFQPRDISKIQEANYIGQSSTSYYNLRASNIRALWAAGVNEGNQSKVADARAAVQDWNAKNPTQKIVIKPNDIAKRVREMRMDKSERVIKKAPKSSRGALAEDFAKAGQ